METAQRPLGMRKAGHRPVPMLRAATTVSAGGAPKSAFLLDLKRKDASLNQQQGAPAPDPLSLAAAQHELDESAPLRSARTAAPSGGVSSVAPAPCVLTSLPDAPALAEKEQEAKPGRPQSEPCAPLDSPRRQKALQSVKQAVGQAMRHLNVARPKSTPTAMARVVPLWPFDDQDMERLQRDKLAAEVHGKRAVALRDELASDWQPCVVRSWDLSDDTLAIRWEDGARSQLPRVCVCLADEDAHHFALRFARAQQMRATAEQLLNFQLYVDCMPTEGVPCLSTEQLDRLLSYSINSDAIQHSLRASTQLLTEVNMEYVRTMNFILFDMHCQQGSLPHVKRPQPRPTMVPWLGAVPVPTYPREIDVLNMAEMPDAQPLADWIDAKDGCILNLSNTLQDRWLVLLKHQVHACLEKLDAEGFDLRETSLTAYMFSKMRRLFVRSTLTLSDTLRVAVRRILSDYVAAVSRVCAARVTVLAANSTSVGFPAGQYCPSLLRVRLACTATEGGTAVEFDTTADEIVAAVAQVFDRLLGVLNRVPTLEQAVLDHLPWGRRSFVPGVDAAEGWVEELRARLTRSVERALAPMSEFQALFTDYATALSTDARQLVASLERMHQGDPTSLVDKLERLVHKHMQQLDASREDIARFVPLGLVCIDCGPVRDAVASKHAEIVQLLLELMSVTAHHSAQWLDSEYTRVNEELSRNARNIEELTELEQFVASVPDVLAQLDASHTRCAHNYELLDAFQHRVVFSDFQLRWKVFGWPKQLNELAESVQQRLAVKREQFGKAMVTEQEKFEGTLESYASEVEGLRQWGSLSDLEHVAALVRQLKEKLRLAAEKARHYNAREALFGMDVTEYSHLTRIQADFEPYCTLWECVHAWQTRSRAWLHGPFSQVNPQEVEELAASIFRDASKSVKTFERLGLKACRDIAATTRDEVAAYRPNVPLVVSLRNPGMQERHWQQVADISGVELASDASFTLARALERGIGRHVDALAKVGEAAAKEHQIEQALVRMREQWQDVQLSLVPYRETGTFVLHGVDELMAVIDEQINTTQGMSFSTFKKPFEAQIAEWGDMLRTLSDVTEEWVTVQRLWLYLQPIFDSPDIIRQLPAEAKRFAMVDKTWRGIVKAAHKQPQALEFCASQQLLDSLLTCNESLEAVQKGLSDYLETKRSAFARFYFLANDELLEILSQTKDPTRVQPHLKKCFEAIKSVDFTDRLAIAAMNSAEGERVPLLDAIDTRGLTVEVWMNSLEAGMKAAVRNVMSGAIDSYATTPRTEWMQQWPGQCVLNGSQVHWTAEVESAMQASGNAGVRACYEQQVKQLEDMVRLVRSELPALTRITIGALAVIDVHARDVTLRLVEAGVQSAADFEWISQLRYYWERATSHGQLDLFAVMVTSRRPYGYEYLGNSARLVITPLTDKCYLTLMGALQMILGGAPAGPAGTGKTETTKDLAKALAKQCVVFNCSDGMDYKMTGKFFKGLASCGAWACFDEFNRITIEVLSVIAQQIMTLQQGVRQGKRRLAFEDSEIRLSDQFAVFITMNPGYAGRSELPDNLKALFRPVAMMVPDYALIGEIMLFSFGFSEARKCARKMVATFRLCSEQLSSQDHYDYGMRAVKTVIVAAGNLKRACPAEDEEVLLIRALSDVNLPKFLAHDLPLFRGIMRDLFPGKAKPAIDYGDLVRGMKAACERRGLQPVPQFLDKCVQLYEMVVVRHGLMVVGPTMGGKTSNADVLQEALTGLAEARIRGPRYARVHLHYLNPKAITMGQLYGEFDPNTREWHDGVLANMIRLCAADVSGDLQWVLFDGPVDTLWIESMNTVLDDNKKLCLNSGEIISLSPETTMMFEPEDLSMASPATVSRCGMVYMEPKSMGYDPHLLSWLQRLPPAVAGPCQRRLLDLFDTYAPASFELLRRHLFEPLPTVDTALVHSLFKLFDCCLARLLSGRTAAGQSAGGSAPDAAALAEAAATSLEPVFLFSLVWSVAATVSMEGRRRFSAFLRTTMKSHGCQAHMPAEGLVYDYYWDWQARKWEHWDTVSERYRHDARMPFSDMIVPTVDSTRYTHLLKLLLEQHKHVCMAGPTGTGKTTNVARFLQLGAGDASVPLMFTFSARTSANQTQDSIDEKTEKRKKGVFGPPIGKRFVLFVDDVNMPQREVFHAQPPIELLRQWLCAGGWFDRKALTWRQLVDTTMVVACGPPGGGRNPITPRFMRHFNLITYTQLQQDSMRVIFGTILTNVLSTFAEEVQTLADAVVRGSIAVFDDVVQHLLPTPAKSHYTFNLRDLGKVFQGMSMADPKSVADRQAAIRLWVHEAQRVFRDRLVSEEDRSWFDGLMARQLQHKFETSVDELLPRAGPPLLFADIGSGAMQGNVSPYREVPDVVALTTAINGVLDDYNAQSKSPMHLVMFLNAVEHLCRVARVLRQPQGNALLLGVGGSGRQSLTRLAAFLASYTVFQVEVTKGYGPTEWREDLKGCLLKAGAEDKQVVLLLSDVQIVYEGMLEDVNNVLNTGDVANLYAADDMERIMSSCRIECQRRKLSPSKLNVFAQYLARLRRNVHVVLCMSPLGEAFRRRLRMFPSLVNCCTIDWFSEWPDEALRSVAERKLQEAGITLNAEATEGCVDFFRHAHQDVGAASQRFYAALRRHNYVTPTSYLELLGTYCTVMRDRRAHLDGLRRRLQNGLDKLATTQEQVGQLQAELTEMQPRLVATQEEVDGMIVKLEKDQAIVQQTKEVVAAEEAEAAEKAAATQAIADDAQRDLAAALPALDEAVACLQALKLADIQEVRSLSKPPAGVRLTMEVTCIMFQKKPVMKNDPTKLGVKYPDYWDTAQEHLLKNPKKLMEDLLNFDKDNIPDKVIQQVERYMGMEEFTPPAVKKASKACEAICMWSHAMHTYHFVAKEVEPKRAKLRVAEEDLNHTLAALKQAKERLQSVEDDIAKLTASYERSVQKKEDLAAKTELCKARLQRAEVLIGGLSSEKSRWEGTVASLEGEMGNLVGDALVCSASIAYLGPFTPDFRRELMDRWRARLVELRMPHTRSASLIATLSDPVELRTWVVCGLPTDSHSIENGIIMAKARRWPLLIDPQGQANRFIKALGAEAARNGMEVLKLSDKNLLRSLETAVQFGRWALLENVGESLDAALEPLLLQQKCRQAGTEVIRIGDSMVPYHDDFRFFITTKLPNPHYAPEVCVKVSLLNFTITAEGLEDQLLGRVVVEEMPELEARKNELVVANARMRKELKEIENRILFMLQNSSGNILDDEELIQVLASSKATAAEINERVREAEETEREIDESREAYRPVARRSTVLYFCVADMASVDTMYQCSLQWFTQLFTFSIKCSAPAAELAQRLRNLDEYFTATLYENVCRSLFERHKLLFSFIMCVRLLQGKGHIEPALWLFLISGQGANTAGEGQQPGTAPDRNPAPEWLEARAWQELTALSTLPGFAGLSAHVAGHLVDWRAFYDQSEAHEAPLPVPWEEGVDAFGRICVLRALRPDAVIPAVQAFVTQHMGARFVEPPPFDLKTCFAASSPTMPLIFVLSAGSDPTNMFFEFASAKGFGARVKALSLGQGQDRVAEKLIERGMSRGLWVYLQNCHLYTSWMPALEQICEGINGDEVHPDFRLWLTSNPSPDFPATLLQNGVKMTMEPPKGLRSNLRNAYYALDDEKLGATTKPRDYNKLLFALSFFHACVQERRKFGPLGWNIPYEFNDSDLDVSRRQLELFLDSYEEVPYKVLNFMVSYINYGGRVTDYIDLRTIDVMLRQLFRPEVLHDDFAFSPSGVYRSVAAAATARHQGYMEYIDSLPLNADPEVFGLHQNANMICARNDTFELFDTVLALQPRTSAAGGQSREDIISAGAADIMQRLPPMFDVEAVGMAYPLQHSESMNTVLLQECSRYNNLLGVMHRSLPELRKALLGLVVMSAELEEMADALFLQKVPKAWEAKAYPSLKPLNAWVQELLLRVEVVQDWVRGGAPAVFWISGFFFPQAFLTGTLQNYARKYSLPIDTLSFGFKLLELDWRAVTEPPMDGVYIRGLFLEGARWNKSACTLDDSLPKQLYTELPVMHLEPVPDREPPLGNVYRCPVYKVLSRCGSLSTTGHSTNFIMWVELPSSRDMGFRNNDGLADQDTWIKAGVAAFCSLRY